MNPSTQVQFFFVCLCLLCCCAPPSKALTDTERGVALGKIKFDTKKIDENGLIGSPDNQVLIAYKFQIPVERKKQKEIKKIDPSIHFFKRPGADAYLCIGEGATEKVLIKLASLPYIFRIERFYGE
jgi:hypothetical protein